MLFEVPANSCNFFNTSELLLASELTLGKLSKTDSSTLIWNGWGVAGAKVVGAKVLLLSSTTVVRNGWAVVVVGAFVVVGLNLSLGRRRLREKSNFFGRFVVGISVVLLTVAASVTIWGRVSLES